MTSFLFDAAILTTGGAELELALDHVEQRLRAWAADEAAFAAVVQQVYGVAADSPEAAALRGSLLGEGLGLTLAAAVQRRLRERAGACGVEPDRLIFAERTPAAQFPDLCRLADLFLDTAHYGAGATGVMALQSGVPLLTCPGEAFVSRMGASLCASVGMTDLIAANSEAYVDTAIALGRDPDQLRQRSMRLLDSAPPLPLFDTAGWVRHWEALLHNQL